MGGFDFTHVLEILIGAAPVAVAAYVAIKVDNGILKTRIDGVDRELAKMGDVLVKMEQSKGRMDRMDDRVIMTGGRLDELSRRVNEWMDRRDEDKCPAVREGHRGAG